MFLARKGVGKFPKHVWKGCSTISPATLRASQKTPTVLKKFSNPGFAASALANSPKYCKNLKTSFWQGGGLKNCQGVLKRMQRHFACHLQGVAEKPTVFKKFSNPGFAARAFANSLGSPQKFGKRFWQGGVLENCKKRLERMQLHFACHLEGVAGNPSSF